MEFANAGFSPDVHRERHVQLALWIPFPCAVILVVTRFISRISRRKVGWDDWFMLVALLLYIGCVTYTSFIIAIGGTRHMTDLSQDPDHLARILRGSLINTIFGLASHAFGIVSIALLLPRLLGKMSAWRHYILWFHVGVYLAITLVLIGVLVAQCDPIAARFYPHMVAEGLAHCPGQRRAFILSVFQSSWGAYLDFLIALLSISFICNLRLASQRKVEICGLLGLCLIAGVLAIVKTLKLAVWFRSFDSTWDSKGLYVWSSLEVSWTIVAGSIPPSEPFWGYLVHQLPESWSREVMVSKNRWSSWLDFAARKRQSSDEFSSDHSDQYSGRGCKRLSDLTLDHNSARTQGEPRLEIYVGRTFGVEFSPNIEGLLPNHWENMVNQWDFAFPCSASRIRTSTAATTCVGEVRTETALVPPRASFQHVRTPTAGTSMGSGIGSKTALAPPS